MDAAKIPELRAIVMQARAERLRARRLALAAANHSIAMAAAE